MRTTDPPNPIDPPPARNESAQDDPRSHKGSLRSKLVLSLAIVFFAFLSIDELVRQRVIEPEFAALERASAVRDANRVLAAMNSEVEHLRELAQHWAAQIRNADSDSSPTPVRGASDAREKLHWAAFVAANGEWTWFVSDTTGDTASQETANQQFRQLVDACSDMRRPALSGLTRISPGKLAMYSVISLDEASLRNRANNSRYVVVGRRISPSTIAQLQDQTQVSFALNSPNQSNEHEALAVSEVDATTLLVEIPLTGLHDQRLADVAVRFPRDITARSRHTTRLARTSFILGSAVALFMLLVVLQRIAIRPLETIREHTDRVAEEGFAIEPLLLNRNDEIGQMANAFDKMMRNLNQAQSQLERASQAAGRSQVASSVIHNVGNVLTNVNSLLDTAAESVEGLRISPLHKLANRLRTPRNDESLLSATPDYLEGLAGSLQADQLAIRGLLATLHDNVCHIHDVIRDQQRHADSSIKSTRIWLETIVEEAISYCQARLDDDMVSIEISGELDTYVVSDRSLLLQILINIISNAHHAMHDSEDQARILTITTRKSDKKIRLEFRDNGCGMTEATMERIFDAHYTTRESGTGLGLHFCALTLKRLGGSIRAFSDGPNQGATFVIELPRDGATSPVINVGPTSSTFTSSLTTQ